jgi:rhodopsin domain-containing protein
MAKISFFFLSNRVVRQKVVNFRMMISFILIWSLFSILAVLFQCQFPHPYVLIPSQCSSHGDIYYPIIVLNILTDAALAVWILPTLLTLKIKGGERLLAMAVFSARIL